MKKITKEMTFAEALKLFPQGGAVMMEHGMGCVGCMMASSETIEEGATAHGIDADALVKEINELMESDVSDH